MCKRGRVDDLFVFSVGVACGVAGAILIFCVVLLSFI